MGKGGGGGVGSKGIEAAVRTLVPTMQARRLLFKQTAEALSTGGRGMRMPFVQQAVARSTASGKQALAGARGILSGTDPAIRGRVLNRISRLQQQSTASIGPQVAQQFIANAPSLSAGGGASAVQGLGIAAAGEQMAQQAAATRAAGFGALAQGLASAGGTAAGAYSSRGTTAPVGAPASAPPYHIAATGAPYNPATAPPSWFARFRG